ncbi:NAD-dependent epimerase/dehydratase family protein [Streptomyces sp. NPDC053048]|uniref:NAD-dependent epimerase/dehydratase family protein n=1 Tax=Streptomyces sp. NPDC053048 TaxID=3365694 RepID=UPI0037D1E75F
MSSAAAPEPFVSAGSTVRDLAGMRIAVTGATGFVGRHVCRRIVGRGGEVVAVVRTQSDTSVLDGCPVDFARADLRSGTGLAQALSGVSVVVHLAGVVRARSRAEFECGNTAVTRTLTRVVAGLPAPPRLVLCSSMAAGGLTSSLGPPRGEDDPAPPVSWYGRSKLDSEAAVRERADRIHAVIVRPPIVYGPGDPAFVPVLAAMVRAGVAAKPGWGPRRYSLLYVDDLADALVLAALYGNPVRAGVAHSGVYHLSDGLSYAFEDLLGTAATVLGHRLPRVVAVPGPLVRAAGTLAQLVGRPFGRLPLLNRDKAREAVCSGLLTVQRARRELGFAPKVAFAEGFHKAWEAGDAAVG